MKTLFYSILAIVVIGSGIAWHASRQTGPTTSPGPVQTVPASPPATEEVPVPPPLATGPAAPAAAQPLPTDMATAPSPATPMASATDSGVQPAVTRLLSERLTHDQRRDILKQLVQSGKIDQAIGELQQQAASQPKNADAMTALGQAYLEKGVAMDDGNPDKVILVMEAMKSFDAALGDDPGNWEARFTRTALMSYYPAEMNRGQEVIDQFSQLIDQQEQQAPQPQFAKTYVLMGDQYKKLGKSDYALATWQAGAALFPNDSTLRKRLASQ